VLDAVGITGTAARIYAELVETDELSAGQVAERCAISPQQAAAELRNIASLGLAFRLTGRPVRYRAVAPDLAISALIAQRETELRDARATMHRLTEVFQETSRGRHPDAQVEVVHGTPNIARLAVHVHAASTGRPIQAR
jgi:sugar-specific transcriptional regulator TrmB